MTEMDTLISFQNFIVCKSPAGSYFQIPVIGPNVNSQLSTKTDLVSENPRVSLLKITGNILYDVNYRSRIDTPYAENDVYQHTLQTRLDVLIKEKYPLRFYLTARFGNSSFFRQYTDLNFQFNPQLFKQLLKQRVLDAGNRLAATRWGKLDSLRKVIDQRKRQLYMLEQNLAGDKLSQRIAEQKEMLYYASITTPDKTNPELKNGIPGEAGLMRINSYTQERNFLDSLNRVEQKRADQATEKLSLLNSLKGLEMTKSMQLRQADSLRTDVMLLEKELRSLQIASEFNMQSFRRKIDSASTHAKLHEAIKEAGLPDSILPKSYKTLYSLRTLGVGRSNARYSELTVTGISISGLQVEYNPGNYYAVAVGKVDYRFRDYIIPNRLRNDQYLALARFGKGLPEGSHLYFTYYTGRRQYFNASVNSVSGDAIPSYHLAGMSVELKRVLTKNISLTAEVAKSTKPYYSLDSLQKSNWMSSITRFSERKNEAYSLRLQAFMPKSLTRINAQVRYTGAHFQSFSTFTTGASQLRWKMRAEQPMLRRKLMVTTTMEQNEYVNPFVNQTYTSSSVLFGLQAQLKLKKWPVLMLGYYPSFQLVKTADDYFAETRYYTLTGSAGYYYKTGNSFMSTHLIFSRFYNASADSGFVYYNASNYLITQMVTIGRNTFHFNGSYNSGTDNRLATLESGGQLELTKHISAGAGLKWIRDSRGSISRIGYNGSLLLKIKKLGDFQLVADKGYLPGMNRQLIPYQTGRMTYFKTF